MNDISRGCVPRKRFAELLRPSTRLCGMVGDRDVHDAPPLVGEDHEHEQEAAGGGSVPRRTPPRRVAGHGSPRRCATSVTAGVTAPHVLCDGRLTTLGKATPKASGPISSGATAEGVSVGAPGVDGGGQVLRREARLAIAPRFGASTGVRSQRVSSRTEPIRSCRQVNRGNAYGVFSRDRMRSTSANRKARVVACNL